MEDSLWNCLAPLSRLQRLDVSACSALKFQELPAALPNLQELVAQQCDSLEDKGLQALGKVSAPLLRLDLACNRRITGQGLKAFAENRSSVTSLDISFCDKLNDGMLAKMGRWPALTRVNLTGNKISDSGVEALLRNCPSLQPQGVIVNHCPEISLNLHQFLEAPGAQNLMIKNGSDATLRCIALCTPPIQSLCLDQCAQVNLVPLRDLLRSLSQLVALQFIDCPFDDGDLCILLFANLNLQCLYMEGTNARVTDKLLKALTVFANGEANLTHFTLLNTPHITQEGVSHLLVNCSSLAYLNLTGCSALSVGPFEETCSGRVSEHKKLIPYNRKLAEEPFSQADAVRGEAYLVFMVGKHVVDAPKWI